MDSILWFNEFSKGNNEFPVSSKSEDEIKKLTLEDNLNEVKRSFHILSKGQQIQKYAVYSNLNKIFLESGAIEKLIPIIQADIMNQTEENQIEASKSLIKLINTKDFPADKCLPFFKLTLSVLSLWNLAVLDNWVLVFNEFLYKIPYENIEKETNFSINNLSEPTQHVLSKYIAARMIGFVAERTKKKFSSQFLDRALSLCHDIDVEVRKIMSQEVLNKVTLAVGKDYAEYKMLDKIIELIYDSDLQVKLASIDVLIEITDLLSDECKRTRVTGTLMDFCSSNNEEIQRRMSLQIGKILYKLKNFIYKEPSYLNTIETFYRVASMPKLNHSDLLFQETAYHRSMEVRKNFIYNIPAMMQMLENKELLKNIFVKMFKDPNKEIKTKCVICFSEVCKVLAEHDMIKGLKDQFELLLEEQDLEILPKLVPQLGELVEIFEEVKRNESESPNIRDFKEKDLKEKDFKDQSLRLKDGTKSYLDAVINIWKFLVDNHMWRLEIRLIEDLSHYNEIYTIKELNDKIAPFLINRMKEGATEVRLKAIDVFAKFVRINYLSAKFKEILKCLVEEFATSSCYQHRISFIYLFSKFGENFSRTFIKQNLLNLIFPLAADKVSQVRRKYAENLIEIRKYILADDLEALQKFKDVVKKLSLDPDKEVAANPQQDQFAYSEDEEKEKVLQEEEFRMRDAKEIEDSKKRYNEEYSSIRFEYLQNYNNILNGTGGRRNTTTKASKYTPPKSVLPSKLTKPTTALGTSITNTPPLKPTPLTSDSRITGKISGVGISSLGTSAKNTTGKMSSNLTDSELKGRKSLFLTSSTFAEKDKSPLNENRDMKLTKDDLFKSDTKITKGKETAKDTIKVPISTKSNLEGKSPIKSK